MYPVTLPLEVQIMIIKEVLYDPDNIVPCLLVCKSWEMHTKKILQSDKSMQMDLLHMMVKMNKAGATEFLIKTFDIDVNMLIPHLAEEHSRKSEWTVLHTACFYGHVEVFGILVDMFDALKDKDVTDLSLFTIDKGHVSIWCRFVEEFGAEI
jgi:hypothetical protein